MNLRTESQLSEFVHTHTGVCAAGVLGVSDSAVWQAIAAQRDIRIELDTDGEPVGWYEIKRPARGVNLLRDGERAA